MARKSKKSVDDFMAKLDEPLKAQVQAVRDIIKGVDPDIGEIVKWNAPSYVYNGADFVTFNAWANERVHLIFHHPACVNIESALLEGDYPSRRMTYFSDMADIAAKRAELERIVGELVKAIGS